MTYLHSILEHVGYEPRPQQEELYTALCYTDDTGTVAQAGTGTGKSIAVLAAGAHWRDLTGLPTLVVVPTNILLKQYIELDAPRVEEALGITIRSLMGRNRYLCEAAPGFAGVSRMPDEIIAREVEMNELLATDDVVTLNPEDAYWFGCPGRDEGCDPETRCSYRAAKAQLDDADIIITNAHLLVLHNQLRAMDPVKRENPDTGEESSFQPRIFPDYGALFVDECHTLEDVLRGFATRSIPSTAVGDCAVGGWLRDMNRMHSDAVAVSPTRELVAHLRELEQWRDFWDDGKDHRKKHEKAASEAAKFILQRGADGAYVDKEAVLWFAPDHPRRSDFKPIPKLISTQINLAGGARRILTAVPFGLVSGTVPQSLRGALGIGDARFVDCGHPFDYARQGKLKISKLSGSFKAVRADQTNEHRRAEEVRDAIVETGGGTLVLFSSYKDLERVYRDVGQELEDKGLETRIQTREGDNGELGRWFKQHGNAVLFGTESFATGFDVPGDALRQVIVWKLPYPGLDPVTKAIMARSRQRYEDMMRMKVTQAVGRLIRTTQDVGTVFIVDSRAESLIGDDDPMLAHLSEFTRIDKLKRVRAWDIE